MDSTGDEEERRWRIGELASMSGLSARALRHYDEIGLLSASERTQSGYRLYDAGDVRRLYEILALRRLGLGLEAIGAALRDGAGATLRDVVRRQRDAVAAEIAGLEALRVRLHALCRSLEAGTEPTVQDIITTLEAMTMYETYYSPEQLERLDARGAELGPERIAEVEREWGELFARLRAAMADGVDPADPSLDPVRGRARELIAMFTGGDAGVAASMRRLWDNEDPAQVSRGVVDRELSDYSRRVFSAGGGVA